jgi:flagellar basal body rod protein FlgG
LDNGKAKLTRDGRFMVDRSGRLVLSNSSGSAVTDEQGNPIVVDPTRKTTITGEGQVNQDGLPFAKLGVFEVSDGNGLIKDGNNLLSHPDTDKLTPVSHLQLRPQFLERANVDPATELTALMDAQRQLEANANMIRYQDQTLGRLVNEVGKIG